MLKKEFNEILKQSLYLVIFIVFLPFLLIIGSRVFGSPVSYLETLFPVFQVGLMIFALVSGISLFTSERKQDGIEYLLTLPISRFKLLFIKIFPRLTALIFFSVLYVLLVQILTGGEGSAQLMYALPAGVFFFMVFSLFIIAVSLSACHHNFLLLALLVLVIFSTYTAAIYRFLKTQLIDLFMGYLDYSPAGIVVVFLLILPLPLLLSFILSFKKFDVGSGKGFNKRYLKFFIPLLIIGLALSFLYLYGVKKPIYKYYYLTKEHKLIETEYGPTRVYDGERVTKVEDARGYVMLEYGDFLYIRSYIDYKKILRMNKKDYQVNTLYTAQGFIKYSVGKYKDTMALIETSRQGESRLVLVNLDTEAVKKIKLPGTGKGGFLSPAVFGADEAEGKRFWLVYTGKVRRYNVKRVWENGIIEKLVPTKTRAAYFNHMLITTNDEGMVFSKITAQGVEVVKKLPQGKRVTPMTYSRKNLDNIPLKEMYGTIPVSGRVLRIDLETFETNWVNIGSSKTRYFYPDHYYCIDSELDKQEDRSYIKTISMLKDGKLKLIKDFSQVKAYREYIQSGWGFVLEVDGKRKVYTLPDCEELTFKGLN